MVLITLLRLRHPQILFGRCSMSIAIPEANSDTSEAADETSTLEPAFETTLHSTPVNLYEIRDKRESENASCLFVRNHPIQEDIDPGEEYVLLMEKLPDDRRLDHLLQKQNEEILWQQIQLLTDYVIGIHMYKHLAAPTPSHENGAQWGSCVQLSVKLEHNLGLFDLMLAVDKDRYSIYAELKETLKRIFRGESQYREYFEQRMLNQRIKHCHGDLKAPNIWILPGYCELETEPWKHVWILDAIDFNPSYRNIDILSDFAMLAVDIQARTKSIELAHKMINYYLEHTNQQDKAAKSVLEYYLVEKAIVGAAVSIVYDRLTELGLAYLEVAQERADKLKLRLSSLEDDTSDTMIAV